MEFLFKRNFWLAWLFFLSLLGWLLARLAAFVISANLQSAPTALPHAPPQSAPFNPVKPQLHVAALAKLMGIELSKDAPTAPAEETAADNNTLSRSSINALLLGTLVSSPPQWSIASIQNNVGGAKIVSVAIGDFIEGASVVAIERERVIVVHNGLRAYIDANAPSAAPPPPPSGPAQADAASNIRELSPNNYEIPRNELEKTLGNLNDIAMQARVVPAFKDGVSQGFRLYSIRSNSFYQKIGIQNGDIVKRINGFDMNSPEKALELYSKLKDSSRIDVEIERNGNPIKKTYNIRAP